MSVESKSLLEAALAAHIADVTEGNILTDYCIIAASSSMDDIGTGSTEYFFEANEGQPPHVSYGLITYAERSGIWDEDDDDF